MKTTLIILILALCSCAQLEYSATTKAGSESFKYVSFGGSESMETAGGTRYTGNRNKTAGQFFQTVTAVAGGISAASVSKSNNALSATQSTNAAAVTKNAADNVTKQTAIKATPVLVPEGQTLAFPPQ